MLVAWDPVPWVRFAAKYAVMVVEKGRNLPLIKDAMEAVARRGCPSWLEFNKDEAKGRVIMFPSREDITMPIQEHLIVELYSK